MNLFDDEPQHIGGTLWGGTLYELAPGESSPYHWHHGEEECLIALTGRPTLRTPDGERELAPWEIAWFPRGERGAHQVRNDGDEPARVVLFSTVSDPELVVYPDDERIRVRAGSFRGWVEES